MPRHPAAIRTGHLMWTRQGSCWAIWQLNGMNYGGSLKRKQVARAAHQAMFRVLTGEYMLLSVVVGEDPADVVERMVQGVDLETHQAWAEEAEARLDELQNVEAGNRLFFLCVPLTDSGFRKVVVPTRAAVWNIKAQLGLPHHGVEEAEIRYRMAQAERVEELIPRSFSPRRVTVAHQAWIDFHLMSRGIDASGMYMEETDTPGVHRQSRHIGEPILDEGGKSDPQPRLTKANPFKHRYVKVGNDDQFANDEATYQAMFALTGLPAGGLEWPGSELLGDIDSFVPGADWVMRPTTRATDAAKRANKKAMAQINDQISQREHEIGTGMHDLDTSLEALTEYDQVLEGDENEVEIQPVILFSVCSDAAADVTSRAQAAVNLLREQNFKIEFPAGYQEDMWWSFVPGAALPTTLREYAQITTSRDLSGLVPMTSFALGDEGGMLFAENHSTSLLSHVFLDLPSMPQKRNKSGCVGLVGDLGSGKSTDMKSLMKAIVELWDGKVIATDRTELGEWVTYASTLTNPIVVDPAAPEFSLDPLRVFEPTRASTVASNFLSTLLDLNPTSELGVLLSDVLTVEYRDAHAIEGLGSLLDHLVERGRGGEPGAKELAGMINVYARKEIGRVLFDDALPILRWDDVSAIVIRTNRLELPEEEELEREHLYRVMSIEKRFGRAMHTLINSMARSICFEDNSQFAAFFIDEAHGSTNNNLAIAELVLFVLDGRKHNAGMILGSHDPEEDFGSEKLRDLIPIRIVHRHEGKALAKRALRWVGLDPDDEDLVEQLTKDTSPQVGGEVPPERRGEAFFRDALGEIGRVRTLLPASAAAREAASTTPTSGEGG